MIDLDKPITDAQAALQFMQERVHNITFHRGDGPKLRVHLWFFFDEDTVEVPDIYADDLISGMESARLTFLAARTRQLVVLKKRRDELESEIRSLGS